MRTTDASRTRPLRPRVTAIALVLLAGPLAAGCAGDDASSPADAGTPPPVAAPPADEGARLGTLTAPDIRTDGVLLAALLLGSGGDLEAAVADGLVTPAEVDTAAEALADGTLDLWVEEAGGSAG